MNHKIKTSKPIVILFFLLFQLFTEAKAQRCGGGILTLNFYTLNGNRVKEFEYEIFPVAKKPLENYYQTMREQKIDVDYTLIPTMWETGIIINENTATELIDIKNDTLNNALIKMLDRNRMGSDALPSIGKIKSSLQFQVFENSDFPIVLKITTKEKKVYVLGNYFGGCPREVSLIWNERYGLRIYQPM